VLTRKNNYYQGEKLGELHLEKEEGNEMQMWCCNCCILKIGLLFPPLGII
jgi:hypothetical protein